MSDIESFKQEARVFNPPAEFVANAAISGMDAYRALCAEADEDYEGFWARLAQQNIQWTKPFTKRLDQSNAPFYKWFEDGELNVSYNCLDRHLTNGNADKVALIFESDDGKVTRATYKELYERVCKFANGLKSLDIKKGDRVVIYMPMSIDGRVRRLLRQVAARTHHRRRRSRRADRRLSSARRPTITVESNRR
jgi:acetyl-CoA synthetase